MRLSVLRTSVEDEYLGRAAGPYKYFSAQLGHSRASAVNPSGYHISKLGMYIHIDPTLATLSVEFHPIAELENSTHLPEFSHLGTAGTNLHWRVSISELLAQTIGRIYVMKISPGLGGCEYPDDREIFENHSTRSRWSIHVRLTPSLMSCSKTP